MAAQQHPELSAEKRTKGSAHRRPYFHPLPITPKFEQVSISGIHKHGPPMVAPKESQLCEPRVCPMKMNGTLGDIYLELQVDGGDGVFVVWDVDQAARQAARDLTIGCRDYGTIIL